MNTETLLSAVNWWALFGHFLSLSLLAIGGAITTTPEMHRYLVSQNNWMTHAQFNNSLSLAQAAPGPNITFVALIGWHLGTTEALRLGAPSWPLGLAGAAICLIGILSPSTVVALLAARWAHKHKDRIAVRAFKAGMAPIVIGLLLSTAWLMLRSQGSNPLNHNWVDYGVAVATVVLTMRTRLHMLWLLAAGAAAGAFGWL